jgi:hypothetical protein
MLTLIESSLVGEMVLLPEDAPDTAETVRALRDVLPSAAPWR